MRDGGLAQIRNAANQLVGYEVAKHRAAARELNGTYKGESMEQLKTLIEASHENVRVL